MNAIAMIPMLYHVHVFKVLLLHSLQWTHSWLVRLGEIHWDSVRVFKTISHSSNTNILQFYSIILNNSMILTLEIVLT